MTLVEASIVRALTTVVLGAIYGSVTSVSTVSQRNNKEVVNRGKQRTILERVQHELTQTGKTGRYTILAGGKTILYAKLTGLTQIGADVSGIWSTDWRIELDSAGVVKRSRPGWVETIGSGVSDLSFVKNPDDSVTVTCTTKQKGRDVARSVRVFPRN